MQPDHKANMDKSRLERKFILGVSVMKGSDTMELEVIPGFTGWTCTWIAAKFLKGNKKSNSRLQKMKFYLQNIAFPEQPPIVIKWSHARAFNAEAYSRQTMTFNSLRYKLV